MSRRVELQRRDLRAVWRDGLAWSAMVGLGEQSIPPFALALGASSALGGLSATVPMLLGALLQLVALPLVARVGSLRRWVVLCAALQCTAFVPLVVGAASERASLLLVFSSATLYWATGLGSAPAWNTWVESLVPARIAYRYWAERWRYLHVCTTLGLLASAGVLAWAEAGALGAFAVVFGLAALARAVSALYLARQGEPEPHFALSRGPTLGGLVQRMRHTHDGALLVYLLAAQFAAQIALPFLVPYLLGPAGHDETACMALLAAAVLGKYVALPYFGRLAERRGVPRLLWVAGIACVPTSLLWLVSDGFVWLCAAQFLAGAAWAAYELAAFLAVFAHVPRAERLATMSWFQLWNAGAVACGSGVGALILWRLEAGPLAFVAVFSAAALARIVSLFLLARAARRPAEGLSGQA